MPPDEPGNPASFDPAAAGWKAGAADGFPGLVGPFWARRDGEGWHYAFTAGPQHVNGRGIVHGGMLMTFADHAFGLTVWEAAGRRPCVTIQLNVGFIEAVRPGDFVESRAEVLRQTRSVTFIRGLLVVGERRVAAADGIWKLLGAA